MRIASLLTDNSLKPIIGYPKIGYCRIAPLPFRIGRARVKRQYLGDINDYRKYRILGHFSDRGHLKIGVCWMLTPDDGGRDGRKLTYLKQPSLWRNQDPALFDLLLTLTETDGQRLLHRIEHSKIIPNAKFFDEQVPDALQPRTKWFDESIAALSGTDIVFLDPDNGIEIKSRPKGRRNSSKHVYWDELTKLFELDHSLIVYQHYPYINRKQFIADLTSKVATRIGAAGMWTARTPHVVFLVIATAKHLSQLCALAETFPNQKNDIEIHKVI